MGLGVFTLSAQSGESKKYFFKHRLYMLQICGVAEKFKTLKKLVVFFSILLETCQKHLKSLAVLFQNPERLITILWFRNRL